MKSAKKAAAKKAASPAKAKKASASSASSKDSKKPAPKNGASSHQVASATTAAILGFAPASSKDSKKKNSTEFIPSGEESIKAEWLKYYKNLIQLRNQLLEQMDGLAKESAEEMASYSLHMADSGTDNFDRDFALSLLSSDQDALYEIEEAIKRIEKDNYGICEITGKPIPKARLAAIPWTRFTVQAQAQLERDGALRNKRLASLGSVDSTSFSDSDDDSDDDDSKSGRDK